MSVTHDPCQNHLLAALPATDFARLQSRLKLMPLRLGEVIYEPDSQLRHLYFPITAIVSLLYIMSDGASSEIAAVGNDGVLGIALFMGGATTPSRAVVQSAGHAYQLAGDVLKDEFKRAGALQHVLLRYTQALLTQMAQTAVCNRHHTLDQQLCRWLLRSLDRVSGNELFMTQELIANLLGVRREGVTEAARKLQTAGLIKYSRGHRRGSRRPGSSRVRVLRGRQEGIGPPAARPHRVLTDQDESEETPTSCNGSGHQERYPSCTSELRVPASASQLE